MKGRTQQSPSKRTCADPTDPRPMSKCGKAKEIAEKLVEENFVSGKISCLVAGSAVHGRMARQRLACAEKQQSIWHQHHGLCSQTVRNANQSDLQIGSGSDSDCSQTLCETSSDTGHCPLTEKDMPFCGRLLLSVCYINKRTSGNDRADDLLPK